jgi:flagellar biosynthetic protein FliQ
MNPQDAIDFSREALKTCMMVGGPILAASLLIGLLVGVAQAMTQVQDQTVSFVPKILLLIVMIGLGLPWLTDQMLDFARLSFEKPMTQWSGTSHQRLFPESKTRTATIEPQPVLPALPMNRSAVLPSSSANRPMIQVSAPIVPESSTDKSRLLELPDADLNITTTPTKSPFILPHYRMSKAPKSEIGG